MGFSLAALKTELTTDPRSYGYAPLVSSSNYLGLKALVNQIRATIQVKRADITASEILEAIDTSDFQTSPAPVTGAIAWFESSTQQSSLRLTNDDGSDTRVLKNLKNLFLPNGAAGANPQTRARLNAIALRDGSRAEELFGVGYVVSEQNIADALNS